MAKHCIDFVQIMTVADKCNCSKEINYKSPWCQNVVIKSTKQLGGTVREFPIIYYQSVGTEVLRGVEIYSNLTCRIGTQPEEKREHEKMEG